MKQGVGPILVPIFILIQKLWEDSSISNSELYTQMSVTLVCVCGDPIVCVLNVFIAR